MQAGFEVVYVMKKFVLVLLTAVSLIVACVKEDGPGASRPLLPRGVSFGIRNDGYQETDRVR